MSTLAEIEKAIATLPASEQRELYRHLGAQIASTLSSQSQTFATAKNAREWARHARGSVRGFPVSAGSESFSADDVARIEGEA